MKTVILKTPIRQYIVPIAQIKFISIENNSKQVCVAVADYHIDCQNEARELIDKIEQYYREKLDLNFVGHNDSGSGPYGSKTFMANQPIEQRGV